MVKLTPIHEILPPEMLEKVLKLISFNEINQARLICRKWREIIDKGNLVKKASGNILKRKKATGIGYFSKELSMPVTFLLMSDCKNVTGIGNKC